MVKSATQKFDSVKEAVKTLIRASNSIRQAIEEGVDLEDLLDDGDGSPEEHTPSWLVEKKVVGALAANAATDRRTARQRGWGEVQIDVRAEGITYCTSGGLKFGWRVHEGAANPNAVTAFVDHPTAFSEDSTLGEALENNGFDVPWDIRAATPA